MATETNTTRRAALKAAPVVALATAVPVAAIAGDQPSPLRALYHHWLATKDAYNNNGLDPDDDPEDERQFEALCEIEEKIAEFRPTTAEDWAFKIIVADDEGCMNVNPEQVALVRLAYEATGVETRPSPTDMIAAALPAVASTSDTPILRMSREIRAIRAEANAYVLANVETLTDEDVEALFYRRIDAIEDEMMATRSTCAADMAAKMLIAHRDGESSCLGRDHPVWMEACASTLR